MRSADPKVVHIWVGPLPEQGGQRLHAGQGPSRPDHRDSQGGWATAWQPYLIGTRSGSAGTLRHPGRRAWKAPTPLVNSC